VYIPRLLHQLFVDQLYGYFIFFFTLSLVGILKPFDDERCITVIGIKGITEACIKNICLCVGPKTALRAPIRPLVQASMSVVSNRLCSPRVVCTPSLMRRKYFPSFAYFSSNLETTRIVSNERIMRRIHVTMFVCGAKLRN